MYTNSAREAQTGIPALKFGRQRGRVQTLSRLPGESQISNQKGVQMKNHLYQIGIGVLSCAALAVFANCNVSGSIIPGSASGGGQLSKPDGTRATLTYHGSTCSGTPVGRFNFIDKSAPGFTGGVMADGAITGFGQCNTVGGCPIAAGQPNCPQGGYVFGFDYRNKNPKVAGDGGTGGACVVDNGEGKNAPGPDQGAIGFETGPYANYGTGGTVNGNVQGHLCD